MSCFARIIRLLRHDVLDACAARQTFLFVATLNFAAIAHAQASADSDNPFATPAERAATAAAQSGENPFATSEEQAAATLVMNQAPYDVVVLREKPPREERVLPLPFPNRKLPIAPKPESSLRLRLTASPETEYEVLWKDIVEVRLYENMVLAEAKSLAEAGRFDDAFAVFTFLKSRYPGLIGLLEAEQRCVLLEAKQTLSARRYENALAPGATAE
ncbi:MAG: hypothetical protein QM775_27560 [Pirellulales bacterium]